jgi:SMODS and SLOG-associating 2TM effector domain 1
VPAKFEHRLTAEFSNTEEEERWIAPYFLRATILAALYQTRFTRLAWAITLLAIAAAAVLGVHLTMNDNSAWDWAEVASLVTLTLIFLVLNRGEFHDRWISYRFLAERLRSARFLIPAGVDFPRPRPTVTAYVERDPSNWIQRTFDEFSVSEREQWHHKRRRERGEKTRNQLADEAALKRRLADQWIGAQISYHGQRFKEHHRWHWLLLTTILVLFAAAVICAILDASGVGRSVTGFLSVLLPAAAASLGALLTVRQDRQLAERSRQISTDLREAQWQINHADEHGLVGTAMQAAHIMAEENEDWLGALWFLDVEHPG